MLLNYQKAEADEPRLMIFSLEYQGIEMSYDTRKRQGNLRTRKNPQVDQNKSEKEPRAFDCCTMRPRLREEIHMRRDGEPMRSNRSEATHGTVIFSIDGERYASRDPTLCDCNCCPHAFLASKSRARYSHHDQPPGPTYESSRKAPERQRSKRHNIEVVDKTCRGELRHRHGREFYISFSTGSSATDIVEFLAPNSNRHQVIVRWNDGVSELLDRHVPLQEVHALGRRLEVKDRKRVSFSA